MALQRRGKRSYGESQADIGTALADYSAGRCPGKHFAEAVCTCGGRIFRLRPNDLQGAAVRTCTACRADWALGPGAALLDEPALLGCACPCGDEVFEITVGVAPYEGSDAVRWLYVGFRCPACGLIQCYGDWKNDYASYRELLKRV